MDEPMNNLENACPICGASDNGPDARYCESCGSKIGTALIKPIPPPNPCELGKVIAERFSVTSLLWTAPTYNAYSATAQDSPGAEYTIIERRLTNGDPMAGLLPVGPEQTSAQSRVSGSLEEAAAAFERFGLYKPFEHAVEGETSYIVFEQIQGQAVAHMDQTDEKTARAIGVQLCDAGGAVSPQRMGLQRIRALWNRR